MTRKTHEDPVAHSAEEAVVGKDHAYALAIAMKQCGCDEKEAKAKLKSVDEAALAAAGRAGNVAECRALLGL